jgi:rhodanese-related sulfurtransferase
MKYKLLMIAVVALAGMFSCTAQNNSFINVSVAEFNNLKEKTSITILDVRTPEETGQGVVKGAQTMNFYEDGFIERASGLDKDQPIYVYCHVGGRSSKACTDLVKAGFTKVYNIDGGIVAWKEAGYELVKK